ncbi:MAG: hypothetical protein ACLUD0_04805 [Eubacterium ramulus]
MAGTGTGKYTVTVRTRKWKNPRPSCVIPVRLFPMETEAHPGKRIGLVDERSEEIAGCLRSMEFRAKMIWASGQMCWMGARK